MSTFDKQNVISFDSLKKRRDLKDKEQKFKAYLATLKQEQLQHEANYLLNKMNGSDLNEEFLLKSALLMDELAKRVSVDSMSDTISDFAKDIRDKIGDKEEELLQ
jgi:hypothetical protein